MSINFKPASCTACKYYYSCELDMYTDTCWSDESEREDG